MAYISIKVLYKSNYYLLLYYFTALLYSLMSSTGIFINILPLLLPLALLCLPVHIGELLGFVNSEAEVISGNRHLSPCSVCLVGQMFMDT